MLFEYDEEYVIYNLHKDIETLTKHANFIKSVEEINSFEKQDFNVELKSYNELCDFLNIEIRVSGNEEDIFGSLEEIKNDTRNLTTKFMVAINKTFDKYRNPLESKIKELGSDNKTIKQKLLNLKPIISKLEEKDIDKIDTDKILKDNLNNVLGMFGVLESSDISSKLEKLLNDFKDFYIIENLTNCVLDLTSDTKQKQIYNSDTIDKLLKEFKPNIFKKIICKPIEDKRLVVGFVGQNCYIIEKCKFMNTVAKSIPYKYSLKKYPVNDKDMFETAKEIKFPNKNEIFKLIELTKDILDNEDKLKKKIINVIDTDNDFIKTISEKTNWENIGLYGIYIESLYIMIKLYDSLPKSIYSLVNIFLNNKGK